ncbi:TetR/AcrR family transcriptional regulator [Antribacter gilvus]|uniref:TetR/AcrR family transcriptional regulator n=1 Tax=Antribacter gilvus TaxID=2304675 RepID=UPI000F794B55|nr:TetR/AcrR family transcriptional regulator [Antribacter gilvus]
MPRPRLHDDALRTRLLEVASRVISASGEGAVTVRAVATEAGTSASAVYSLFGSREDLVAAVSAEGFRRFATHLAAAPRTADPVADLAGLGLSYRRSALADPHFYRVMFARAVPPGPAAGEPAGGTGPGGARSGTDDDGHARPVPATELPTFGVLRAAVARVLDGAPPERVEDAAVGLWGLVHGLVSLELVGLLPGDDATRERRYADALSAVGPPLLRS